MISPFPKLFHVGHPNVQDIFLDDVEVTEKLDGSQFCFGKNENGFLYIRSKGAAIDYDAPPKMFQEGVSYVLSIQGKIHPNEVYYCEYLQKLKHNTLTYTSVPKNHLVLFGKSDYYQSRMVTDHEGLSEAAEDIGVDVVPLLYKGRINSADQLLEFLKNPSYLGGPLIEGVVVKNYTRTMMFSGKEMPLLGAKYVSEQFKELHKTTWKRENTASGGWDHFIKQFRTEARWNKAIQFLRDTNQLTYSPKDIGLLLEHLNRDIIEEEKEYILKTLWKLFSNDVLREAKKGFPEYYKKWLVEQTFNE